MNDFLKEVYWNNTVLDYVIAGGSIILLWLVLRLLKNRIIHFLHKLSSSTNTIFDDLLISALSKIALPFVSIAGIILIIRELTLPVKAYRILEVVLIVVTTWYLVKLVNFIIHGSVHLYMERKNEPPERLNQSDGILKVIYVMVWIAGIIMMIDNLGFDITTIITGLGIGGIAIALAAQNVLGDLFSYLVIFFDKPFEIGDFIKTGNQSGTVERIGIKTSHLRSPDGQQLVMPNAELVKSVIHNFKRLERRRVVFNIGVVYQTSAAKIRSIPVLIEEIIRSQPNVGFDRVHLKSFGEFSLNYEVVFFIESTEYIVYMNSQQEILFKIVEKFEAEKIVFAYPTQTIFLEDENAAAGKTKPLPTITS